jgi:hypothetical protein
LPHTCSGGSLSTAPLHSPFSPVWPRPTVDREGARCPGRRGPDPVGHGPRRREKPREPATGPSRSTRRSRSARLPPSEANCGLLAQHTPDRSVQPASYRPDRDAPRARPLSRETSPDGSIGTRRFSHAPSRARVSLRVPLVNQGFAVSSAAPSLGEVGPASHCPTACV